MDDEPYPFSVPPLFMRPGMDAPVCRICGQKHWSRLCHDDNVTKRDADVTKGVTEVCDAPGTTQQTPRSVAPSKLAAAEAEIERLRADIAVKARLLTGQAKEIDRLTCEVEHLKKLLADAHEKTVPVSERNRIALTPAERKRRQRAKVKQ